MIDLFPGDGHLQLLSLIPLARSVTDFFSNLLVYKTKREEMRLLHEAYVLDRKKRIADKEIEGLMDIWFSFEKISISLSLIDTLIIRNMPYPHKMLSDKMNKSLLMECLTLLDNIGEKILYYRLCLDETLYNHLHDLYMKAGLTGCSFARLYMDRDVKEERAGSDIEMVTQFQSGMFFERKEALYQEVRKNYHSPN